MYVARTLSSLFKHPETLSEPPPAGPWSGVVVILDREFIRQNPGRGDSSNRTAINYLPFPQNKLIEIADHRGESPTFTAVMMIPAVDRPLSSHTYYVIQATGEYSGLVIPCSMEEDTEIFDYCCGPTHIFNAAKPKQFDPNNICQQIRILKSEKDPVRYRAQSFAYDGLVPNFMSKPNWQTTTAITTNWTCSLNEADGQGMCESLRNCLPDFDFSVKRKTSDYVAVGSWYVPFIFVKEFGMRYKELMRSSMYYTMRLEQRWERDVYYGNKFRSCKL